MWEVMSISGHRGDGTKHSDLSLTLQVILFTQAVDVTDKSSILLMISVGERKHFGPCLALSLSSLPLKLIAVLHLLKKRINSQQEQLKLEAVSMQAKLLYKLFT